MGYTYREIVYFILDSIKSLNGDSTITEEHVIFLADNYRLFLLEQKKKKEGISSLSPANEQTICVNLQPSDIIEGIEYCNDTYLKSDEIVPDVLDVNTLKVTLSDMFNVRTAFVSKDRFKFIGNNKYLKNIIYCTLGSDNHIYFNSANTQFKYLKKAQITGIFENAKEAAALSCSNNDEEGEASNCSIDILDTEFPLESDLLPQMFELMIKQLLGVNYRPKDSTNSASDDLADIAAFVRRQMKSPMAKQMTE